MSVRSLTLVLFSVILISILPQHTYSAVRRPLITQHTHTHTKSQSLSRNIFRPLTFETRRQGLKFRRSALKETASKLSFPKKIEDDSKQEQEQHAVPSEADAERFVQSMTEKEQAKATTLHSSLSKVGTALDTCTTCVYVLERIKMGYQYMLPSICVELYSLSTDAATFQQCHEVLAGLSVWGNNIRSWFQEGCYKAEPYGAMEKITPCPSHVICSQMQSLTKKDFCVKPEADFKGEGGKF